MRCQEFFLTRFITKCLIFVFSLNCVITAEAGMVLGEICFKFPGGLENKEDTGTKVPIYAITSGKIEEINVTEKECTIEKVCKDNCPSGQIKPTKIQLIEVNPNSYCYHYRVFIFPGKYHMQCDNKYKCSAPVISHYWSSLRDINFTLSDKPPACKE